MATLLDSLTSLATPAVSRIAHRLGESDAAVARGLQTSVASVLGGLLTKSADVSGIHRIFDLITSRDNASGPVDNVSSLLGGNVHAEPIGHRRFTLLSTLFSNRVGSVGEIVARTAGFKNPASGASILSVAAPLVLGYFGKRVRDGSLTIGSLTSLLAGERDNILAAAPAGLSSLVDMSPSGARPTYIEPPRPMPERDRAAYTAGGSPPVRSNRWLWPLLALAALLLIWFTTMRGRGRPTGGSTARWPRAAWRSIPRRLAPARLSRQQPRPRATRQYARCVRQEATPRRHRAQHPRAGDRVQPDCVHHRQLAAGERHHVVQLRSD